MLWLETLDEISRRAGHELRGALNGVAVNIEVVRSRAAKRGAEKGGGEMAAGIAPFAAAAAAQLSLLTEMVEALLALSGDARRKGVQPGVATTVARLIALIGGAGSSDRAPERTATGALRLDLDPSLDGGATTASPAVVRLVLASAILAVPGSGGEVGCRLRRETATISVELAGGSPIRIADGIAALAVEAGIGVRTTDTGLVLSFPAE